MGPDDGDFRRCAKVAGLAAEDVDPPAQVDPGGATW